MCVCVCVCVCVICDTVSNPIVFGICSRIFTLYAILLISPNIVITVSLEHVLQERDFVTNLIIFANSWIMLWKQYTIPLCSEHDSWFWHFSRFHNFTNVSVMNKVLMIGLSLYHDIWILLRKRPSVTIWFSTNIVYYLTKTSGFPRLSLLL